MKTGGVGTGLSASIPNKREETVVRAPFNVGRRSDFERTEEKMEGNVMSISVDKIDRNPEQPRKEFSEEELQDLAQSIREHGILQPLLVSQSGNRFTLIAGERRLRASKRAGLKEVPCLVHAAVTSHEQLELAIIENVQREDLNPIDQALAYKKLHVEFGMSHEEIAKAVGKERPSISNAIRVLNLPEEMQKAMRENRLQYGHARALLGVADQNEQREMFQKMMDGTMGTRDLEHKMKKVNVSSHTRITQKDPQLASYEEDIARVLGTRVRIKNFGESGGNVIIEYYSQEELSGIVEKIGKQGN
jgi:ParB family chromosome partitioning protein